jgi:hypothetical protein
LHTEDTESERRDRDPGEHGDDEADFENQRTRHGDPHEHGKFEHGLPKRDRVSVERSPDEEDAAEVVGSGPPEAALDEFVEPGAQVDDRDDQQIVLQRGHRIGLA